MFHTLPIFYNKIVGHEIRLTTQVDVITKHRTVCHVTKAVGVQAESQVPVLVRDLAAKLLVPEPHSDMLQRKQIMVAWGLCDVITNRSLDLLVANLPIIKTPSHITRLSPAVTNLRPFLGLYLRKTVAPASISYTRRGGSESRNMKCITLWPKSTLLNDTSTGSSRFSSTKNIVNWSELRWVWWRDIDPCVMVTQKDLRHKVPDYFGSAKWCSTSSTLLSKRSTSARPRDRRGRSNDQAGFANHVATICGHQLLLYLEKDDSLHFVLAAVV